MWKDQGVFAIRTAAYLEYDLAGVDWCRMV